MVLLLVACHRVDPADLVLSGGVVYTMEEGADAAEALAVTSGRIVAVGTNSAIGERIGPDTTVIELAGRVVLPGFVDAHTHVAWGGMDLMRIDLWEVASMDELLGIVGDYAAAHPEEAWVQGAGWDASVFEGQMDRALLDAIVPDRPVFLLSADGHSAWVNSRALEAAGIRASTADPEGGEIVRDDDGEPTGVLRESAVELVSAYAPELGEASIDSGLAEALVQARSFGITTIIDANCDDSALEAYARADAAGSLDLRVYGAVEAWPDRNVDQISRIANARTEYGSELLHVSAVKLYFDGVIESGTAYLVDPYEDGTNGDALFDDATLDTFFAAADDEGLQLHVHAIGDGAVRQMFDAIERLEAARGPADRRPLAAHIELIQPSDVPRFAELGVHADFQPLWAYPDAYITDLTVPVIGDDRAAWLYPIGDVAASGAMLVAGSDWNVSTNNPWEAIEVAVTRQDPEVPGDVLGEEQRVDVATILAAYTRDGARAVFAEDELGTLAVGKRADLVVIDRDPFAIDATELSDVTVDGTWLEGEQVFDRGDGATAKRVRRRPH